MTGVQEIILLHSLTLTQMVKRSPLSRLSMLAKYTALDTVGLPALAGFR
jgi:hypothetical protein